MVTLVASHSMTPYRVHEWHRALPSEAPVPCRPSHMPSVMPLFTAMV